MKKHIKQALDAELSSGTPYWRRMIERNTAGRAWPSTSTTENAEATQLLRQYVYRVLTANGWTVLPAGQFHHAELDVDGALFEIHIGRVSALGFNVDQVSVTYPDGRVFIGSPDRGVTGVTGWRRPT